MILSRLETESSFRRVCDHGGGHWRGVYSARVFLLPYIIGNAKRTSGQNSFAYVHTRMLVFGSDPA